MIDASEPPDGDFVAYVEKIEREQMARALQPHRQPVAGDRSSAVDATASHGGGLSSTEAQRVVQLLKAQAARAALPRGAIIGAFIGAALTVFGLVAEGGMFFVILGAVLLWHNLRRLRRSAGQPAGTTRQHVEQVFGQKSDAGTARRRA